MSREYMFRGKRIDNGEWVYGYLFKIWEQTFILWGTTNGVPNMLEVDPESVGQYTGLKDKNGKGREMYEGDIYKQEGRHYVIEWSEYHCGWVVRSLASGAVLPGHLKNEVAVYDDYEYIGSIHEHPHLLEARSAIGTTE